MKRNCDECDTEYDAKPSDLKRGWGLTCSKSCAAKKREQSREDYDAETVELNNRNRELWFHKYRDLERRIVQENPTLSKTEIWDKLFELTQDPIFLSKDAKNTFLF